MYSLAPLGIGQAEVHFPQTIETLKFLHGVEISIQKTYQAIAAQARAVGQPGIGNLFRALALAEEIHARNFMKLLLELGVEESGVRIETEILSTRENLGKAIETELYHIETAYPESMENLRYEGHDKVISFVDYAWQTGRCTATC